MTGLLLQYNGVFDDASLPYDVDDPILSNPNEAGSLFLIDVGNWAAGVPTDGAALTNIAVEQATAAGLSSIDGAFAVVGNLVDGTHGLIERTAKGGLHVIVSQASAPALLNGFNVNLPDSIMNYMISNKTHNYYISQWRNLTRVAAATSPDGAKTMLAIEHNGASTGYARMTHTPGQNLPNPPAGSRIAIGRNVAGANFENIAGTPTDASPVLSSYLARSVAQWGTVYTQNHYSVTAGALQSWIFYRAYIEDLTASGRTYAEVDAIDYGLWQAAFGAGGRFASDTFTAPSTLP